jgi:glycine/D-amino acid oxidase-like deaminating enzyme
MNLTRRRKLTTGTPLWLTLSRPNLNASQRATKKTYDVVVIGTGVSGALVSDALLNAGFSVLAIDRRKPMSGSTTASTALLLSELDTPLGLLTKKIGKSRAARAWLRSALSVGALYERIQDLDINCDLEPRSSIYLPGNVLGARALRDECTNRQKLGLRSAFLDRKELLKFNGIKSAGAILTRGNAEVDPVKLVAGLWKDFLRRGGVLIGNREVVDLDESRNRVRLVINDGSVVHAKHAVLCTGYELMECVRPSGYRIISTWVLATKPQPQLLWRHGSLVWQASDPYLYFRTTADGRVVVGGEDEDFADEKLRDRKIPNKIAAIARKAKTIFPDLDFNAEFAWAGCFGESSTGLPAVGLIKGFSRCYSVLGFGGNGITFSMLAAQLVSRHMQGIADPDAELFAQS